MANAVMDRSKARERALGYGLALRLLTPGVDIGRDLAFVRGPDGARRLAEVSGPDCLAQDLEVALTTALASDVFNTAFGFDGLRALAEESRPALVRERVRVAIVQTLRREPRIRRVLDAQAAESASSQSKTPLRTLRIDVEAEVVIGEPLRVSLVLPTVARLYRGSNATE